MCACMHAYAHSRRQISAHTKRRLKPPFAAGIIVRCARVAVHADNRGPACKHTHHHAHETHEPACVRACMCACVHASVRACIHAQHAHMHLHRRPIIFSNTRTHAHAAQTNQCANTPTCMLACARVHMSLRVRARMGIRVSLRMYMSAYV